MKRYILAEIIRGLQSKPHLKKKLKVLAIVGIVGFFVTSGLVIWAGVSAIQFASHQIQGLNIPEQVKKVEVPLSALPTVTPASCWEKAQSLMNVEPWVTRPLADNLNHLRVACLNEKNNTPEREQSI